MYFATRVAAAAFFVLLPVTSIRAAAPGLPVIDGEKVLATVNGDPITLAALETQLRRFAAENEGAGGATLPAPSLVLERMIDARLGAQEAVEMGLDQLPELRKQLEVFEKDTLQAMLLTRRSREITSADPVLLQRDVRAATTDYKVDSVIVTAESDAKALVATLKAGTDFEKATAKLIADKKAQPGDHDTTVRGKDMMPSIQKEVAKAKPGSIIGPVKIGRGYVVMKVLESRVVNDPGGKREAEVEALRETREAGMKDYVAELVARYAKVDEKLFESLDFEAKSPGFDALLKDRRTVAAIEDDPPVTVADVAGVLAKRYFHGLDRASEKKRLNKDKQSALETLLRNRVIQKEALRLKLDKTPEYRARVGEYRDSMLFGAFVTKAILPGIKLSDSDLEKYLTDHPKEFASSTSMRLESLVFGDKAEADAMAARLRRGTDVKWVKTNAKTLLDPDKAEDIHALPSGMISVPNLPGVMRSALDGATPGDVKLFGQGEGPFYVVVVREVIPGKQAKLEDVKDQVKERATAERIQSEITSYVGKLRSASKLEVFATGPALDKLLPPALLPPPAASAPKATPPPAK